MKRIALLLITLTFILPAGCGKQPVPPEMMTTAPETHVMTTAAMTTTSINTVKTTTAETSPPYTSNGDGFYITFPTAAELGIDGVNGTIFDACMSYILETLNWRGTQTYILPMIQRYGVSDSYMTPKGATVIAFSVYQVYIYDFNPSSGATENTGCSWYPAMVEGRFDDSGNFIAERFEPAGDGAGYGDSVRAMCGPNTALAGLLLDGSYHDVPELSAPSPDVIFERWLEMNGIRLPESKLDALLSKIRWQ